MSVMSHPSGVLAGRLVVVWSGVKRTKSMSMRLWRNLKIRRLFPRIFFDDFFASSGGPEDRGLVVGGSKWESEVSGCWTASFGFDLLELGESSAGLI